MHFGSTAREKVLSSVNCFALEVRFSADSGSRTN